MKLASLYKLSGGKGPSLVRKAITLLMRSMRFPKRIADPCRIGLRFTALALLPSTFGGLFIPKSLALPSASLIGFWLSKVRRRTVCDAKLKVCFAGGLESISTVNALSLIAASAGFVPPLRTRT